MANEQRTAAKPSLDAGMLSIIHAFNLTDDPGHGYGFPAETRARAEAMLRDLYKLFQESEIKPRAAALETDQPFQRFMQRVIEQPSQNRAPTSRT